MICTVMYRGGAKSWWVAAFTNWTFPVLPAIVRGGKWSLMGVLRDPECRERNKCHKSR